jgi:hypothetical protein
MNATGNLTLTAVLYRFGRTIRITIQNATFDLTVDEARRIRDELTKAIGDKERTEGVREFREEFEKFARKLKR